VQTSYQPTPGFIELRSNGLEKDAVDIQSLSQNQVDYPFTYQPWFGKLDYIGDIALTVIQSCAIFSSARCPANLIIKAHDYAKEIRDGEMSVISGFHAPAEKEVFEVLLKGKCPIVVVLGRSLQNARIPTAWKTEIEKGRMLVISPFKKYQKYVTKEVSLQCNDLAAHMAGRALIIHASEGGSLETQVGEWGKEGLKIEYL